jgi:predicted nucleic acid-binding protein
VNTAVDSNVLLDLLLPAATDFRDSRAAVSLASEEGEVVICEAVLAEIAAHVRPDQDLIDSLDLIGVTFVPSSPDTLLLAGRTWVEYARTRPLGLICPRCGAEALPRCNRCEAVITSRQRVLPDFLIGAHALEHAERLLTRDKAIYRRYFPDLELI